jgi:protein gp37
MTDTKIQWTEKVWNPIRGCSRISEGCRNCYAERMAARFAKPGEPFHGFADPSRSRMLGPSKWTGRVELIPDKLDEPLRWRKPARVFVNSMSDLFHESLSFEDIAAVYGAMTMAQQHTFQVLTKRPRRRLEFHAWREARREDTDSLDFNAALACEIPRWPLPNVWEGVSVEDQKTADERIPLLLQTPAAVSFISLEPMLGPVDVSRFMWPVHDVWPAEYRSPQEARAAGATVTRHRQALVLSGRRFLDWVIVGGESGPGARPCDVAWIRSVVRQCREAGVPCFTKQWGSRPTEDGRPIRLKSPKGGDPEEWGAGDWPREFPA